MRSKLTTTEFINKAKLIQGDKYLYHNTKYIRSDEKVIITCSIHGDFEQIPRNHLQGRGCAKCSPNTSSNKQRFSSDDFINKANVVHNNIYNYSKVEYINSQTKIKIICPEHGEFEQIPNSHLLGHGCSKCGKEILSKKFRKDVSEFISKASIVHDNKYSYEKFIYTNNKVKSIITCKLHGDFYQNAYDHLTGRGCPKCILKSQTILFQKLQNDFKEELFLWEYSPEWLQRQRFDIFLPKYNTAIEYNGIQHYEIKEFFGGEEAFINQQGRDNLKKEKCIDNNCNMIEVKYDYTMEDYNALIVNIKNIITQDNVGLINKIE